MLKTLLACTLIQLPVASVGLTTMNGNTSYNHRIKSNYMAPPATTNTAQDILDKINKLPKNSITVPQLGYIDASRDKDAINNSIIKVSNGASTTDDVQYITQYTGTLKTATVNSDKSINLNFVPINFDIQKDGNKVSGVINIAMQASTNSRLRAIESKITTTDFYLAKAKSSTEAREDKKWIDQALKELNPALTDSDLSYMSYAGILNSDHKSEINAYISINNATAVLTLHIQLSDISPDAILWLINKTEISIPFTATQASTTDPATIAALRLAVQKANYGKVPTPYLRFLTFSNATLTRNQSINIDVTANVQGIVSKTKTLDVTWQYTPAQAAMAHITNVKIPVTDWDGADIVSTWLVKDSIIKNLQKINPKLTTDEAVSLSFEEVALHRYQSTNVLVTSTYNIDNITYVEHKTLQLTLEADAQAISNKIQKKDFTLNAGADPTFIKQKATILQDVQKANPTLSVNDMACLDIVSPEGGVLNIGTWTTLNLAIKGYVNELSVEIKVLIPSSATSNF